MKIHAQNPFYEELPTPDEKKKPKEGIPNLEGLLKKYEKVLEKPSNLEYKKMIGHIDDILTPKEINLFLQQTIKYENHRNYCNHHTSYFISKLMQNSYKAGNNNFFLHTSALNEIGDLCTEIVGRKNKPICITIEGNVGARIASRVKYANIEIKSKKIKILGFKAVSSTFKIHANVGKGIGERSIRSNFEIFGDAGDLLGNLSNKSKYIIHGDVGAKCGSGAEECEFIVYGEFGENISGVYKSNECTYVTYERESYEQLLDELDERNIAILKDENDDIIEEKTL